MRQSSFLTKDGEMPEEELYIIGLRASEHKKTSPAVLNLVKPTAFEELYRRVADRNVVRDFHIWILIRIMDAYSFMRCHLNSDNCLVTASDINAIKNKLKIDRNDIDYEPLHIQGDNERIKYFKRQVFWDCLARFHISQGESSRAINYMGEIVRTFGPLSLVALEENLWDPGKREVNPEKLKEYIAKYTWAFPPNTLELLKEMLALPEIRREFEEARGVKLTDPNLAETECGLMETV